MYGNLEASNRNTRGLPQHVVMVFCKLVQSFDIFAIKKNELPQDGGFQFKVRTLQAECLFWYARLNILVSNVNCRINQTI